MYTLTIYLGRTCEYPTEVVVDTPAAGRVLV